VVSGSVISARASPEIDRHSQSVRDDLAGMRAVAAQLAQPLGRIGLQGVELVARDHPGPELVGRRVEV